MTGSWRVLDSGLQMGTRAARLWQEERVRWGNGQDPAGGPQSPGARLFRTFTPRCLFSAAPLPA